ncbi:MAG: hypothetical protein ACRC8F_10890 [Cetobacterium sp.]|uniref:hypothetical protein n=1 Tax=Cetobacterium sp. TaxID=2071632 RepID=UPI003F3B922E
MNSCGVNVIELESLEEFPDSCFVEDTAVLTKKCAIISNPEAKSRNKEIQYIIPTLKQFYSEENIEYIKFPETLEGGRCYDGWRAFLYWKICKNKQRWN